MINFSPDDETFDEMEFNKLLHRINVMDYLLYKCNYSSCDYTYDELSAIKAETTKKVISILRKVNPECIDIYKLDNKCNVIKYENDEDEGE